MPSGKVPPKFIVFQLVQYSELECHTVRAKQVTVGDIFL